MDTVAPTPPARTSAATTRQTEPEVVAGISSAEGQPAGYSFAAGSGASFRPALLMVGSAVVLGIFAGLGLAGGRRRG